MSKIQIENEIAFWLNAANDYLNFGQIEKAVDALVRAIWWAAR